MREFNGCGGERGERGEGGVEGGVDGCDWEGGGGAGVDAWEVISGWVGGWMVVGEMTDVCELLESWMGGRILAGGGYRWEGKCMDGQTDVNNFFPFFFGGGEWRSFPLASPHY